MGLIFQCTRASNPPDSTREAKVPARFCLDALGFQAHLTAAVRQGNGHDQAAPGSRLPLLQRPRHPADHAGGSSRHL